MVKKLKKENIRKIKINDNRKHKVIIVILSILTVILVIAIGIKILVTYQISKDIMTTESTSEEILADKEIQWFENREKETNITNIISQNLEKAEKEEIETQVVELEYETEYKNNSNLPKGMVKVLQQGKDGKQEIIIRKKYEGAELISNEQIGRKIITPCLNKIIEVGTASYYDNHKIKIGETVYATPYSLSLREKAKKDAEVIITIDQDSKLTIKKKINSWYYVQYNSYYGWVEKDCVTYINPQKITYNNNHVQYSKQQLLAKLNKNMNLMRAKWINFRTI